ncbi:deoxynucleoside kinase [Pseudomonas sp. ADAK13]|uniref:deoxynucleoside kinase n=1 Tax=Pseudomonas sp. ADAK13 TaxID=2730847 RepID=UPI001462EC35|nr:deoxynucleoside kinase [Pseudomonas sp. ADAK13]QJI34069.1 deoxynucleoside kinase [Pseudomonas sp. ADAK13]
MVTLAPKETPEQLSGRRIEILGVFGSGKTTLARKLVAESNETQPLLAEQHEQNLFWGAERHNQILGYLPYDLSFLMQHAHLVASINSDVIHFCDWSFGSDRVWASMRLDSDFSAYEVVSDIILKKLPSPLGYLYLKQPVELISKRLGLRGRVEERNFLNYVKAAAEQLDEFARTLSSNQVLEVTDDVSLAEIYAWLEKREENGDE